MESYINRSNFGETELDEQGRKHKLYRVFKNFIKFSKFSVTEHQLGECYGIKIIILKGEEIQNFYENLDYNIGAFNIRPNEYIIFKDEQENILGKKKFKDGKLLDVPYITIGRGKGAFKPLNIEQQFYFDLLQDDTVPIKVCVGIAGTGKTKCALKFGFKKLSDSNSTISKIMVVRNAVEVGERIGYFKGDKVDKLSHWNNPVKDNIDDRLETLEELIAYDKIELETPSTMQGRDLKNYWIIVDEAQHLTYEQFKLIGERVSYGSKIIFIGDLNQIYNPKFKKNNGLERVFKLRGFEQFGCIELKEDVRSETSKIFATLY